MRKQLPPETPVYLFLGFLESGKTKFIQETLEDKRFDSGENTLLLVTEEGEEEYDPSRFKVKRVFTEVLSGKEELTEANLSALQQKYDATRVLWNSTACGCSTIFTKRCPKDGCSRR